MAEPHAEDMGREDGDAEARGERAAGDRRGLATARGALTHRGTTARSPVEPPVLEES